MLAGSFITSADDVDDSCADCFVEAQSKLFKTMSKSNKGGYGWPSGSMVGGGIMMKPGKTNSSGSDEQEKTSTSQMNDFIMSMIDKTPQSFMSGEEKQAFKGYLDLLGAKKYSGDSVGDSNKGVNAYFDSLWGASQSRSASSIFYKDDANSDVSKIPQLSQCFRDTALNFYRDVALRLKSINKTPQRKTDEKSESRCDDFEKTITKKSGGAIDYGCSEERPGLFSKVGDKNSSNLDPGWLWKLALKHSNGNTYAAMHLIGMCGHDDTAQSRFSYYDNSEAAKSELSDQLQKLKEKKVELEKQVKEAAQKVSVDPAEFMKISRRFSSVLEKIKGLKNKEGISRKLSCPPHDSAFYAPGGLSEEADISPALKDKISKVQNPTGKLNIPAKHYHVYGSAFMACNLVTNGFDPQKAITVQKQAARMYRGTRMCETSNDLLEQSKEFEKTIGREASRNWKSAETFIMDGLKNVDLDSGECKGKTEDDKKNCTLALSMFGDSAYIMKRDPELAKRKILNRLARIDAANLYNSWYVGGGEILGKKIPCTDLRMGGPKNLMDANNSVVPLYGGRPDGWSKERYDAATKYLATWDVDFEWTIAQHEAGAKFAAKNCKKAKPGENPFQNLCSDKGTPPNPTTTVPQKSVR